MKGRLKIFSVILLAVFFAAAFSQKTLAWTVGSEEYDKCIENSNGHGHLETVKWACEQQVSSDDNVCTLWIGFNSKDQSVTVELNDYTDTATVYFYGMCTKYATGVDRLSVSDDGDSVDDQSSGVQSFTRGTWGNPTSVQTTIDLAKFINGSTVSLFYDDDGKIAGTQYYRNISIYRCHPNSSSCDTKTQDLTLKVKRSNVCGDGTENNEQWVVNSFITSNFSVGITSVLSAVKNKTLNSSGGWTMQVVEGKQTGATTTNSGGTVYAKPGDTILFRHCYFPGVQSVYLHNGITDEDNSFIVNRSNMFKKSLVSMNTIAYNQSFATGTSKVINVRDTYTVRVNNVLKAYNHQFSESSESSNPSMVWNNAANNNNQTVASSISVTVPYNFTLTPSSTVNGTVYSGETVRVISQVAVQQKYNSVTRGTYATTVEDATIRLYGFASTQKITSATTIDNVCSLSDLDICDYATIKSGVTLNNSGNTKGVTESFSGTYNIPDVDAGNYYCVVTAVYPASSGSDTNTSTSGSNSWAVSTPTCSEVNHRATFQIWGGNLYATGNIAAKAIVKNNLDGYQLIGNNSRIVFSSWVENMIIGGGSIEGVASGAATGYTSNDDGNLISDPGGKQLGTSASVICSISPLTISNKDCNAIGNSDLAHTASKYATSIRSRYIEKAKDTQAINGNNSVINLSTQYAEVDGIRYTYITGNAKLTSSSELELGTTHIIYVTGNAEIGCYNICSNGIALQYYDGPYTSAKQIPQYIIVSEGTLSIHHEVNRVDAQLIADTSSGNVVTCAEDFNAIDDPNGRCMRQLIVNGIVIANSITLNRSYGAGVGNQSGTPAEIFNQSLSMYLWSASNAQKNPTTHTVYLKELSPRY